MAKVSICIPAYKDVEGIRRLLRSIAESEYKDYEVIITDDTPDESISDAVSSFEKDNSVISVRYVHNTEALGPAGNWNHSISLASGEYIKIMHQDDWFTDSKSLGKFADMLDKDPDAVLAFSGSRQVDLSTERSDGSSSEMRDKASTDEPGMNYEYYDRHITPEHLELVKKDGHNLFLGGYIGAPSAVIYRNCDVRFDDKLKWLIDSDFYIRLLERKNVFANTDEPLVCIGVSSAQLTNSCASDKDVNISEHKYLYEKYKLSGERSYQDKLIDIVVSYGGKFADIADCGIDPDIYKQAEKKHDREKREFYLNLIRTKLGLNK